MRWPIFDREQINSAIEFGKAANRGIISKEPDGRTQKLRVKKDFYEGNE